MSDPEILILLEREFGSVPRPEKFTCKDGDPECMDHDAKLHSWTAETLQLKDVTNICYDPWTECLPQGKAYFLPAMARLALEQARPCDDWYAGWLGHRLGFNSELFEFCSASQRGAILEFLDHLLSSRSAIAEEECWLVDLTKARAHLELAIGAAGFAD